MPIARRLAALLAAALALALGVRGLATRTETRREPATATILRSLVGAPIPTGSVVLLVPPPGLSEADRGPWLMEATWQRPDLRWQLDTAGKDRTESPLYCAVVGETADNADWRVVARVAGVTILRRQQR